MLLRVVVVIVVIVRKTNLKEPLLFNWCIALCQQIISNLNNGEHGAGVKAWCNMVLKYSMVKYSKWCHEEMVLNYVDW